MIKDKDKVACTDCLMAYHSIPPYDRTFNPNAQDWYYQKYIMETFDKDILFECETQLGVSHFDIKDIKGETIVNEREIKLVSAPVIEYSILDQIAQEVKEDLAKVDIKAIAPTEDSLSFLKKLRAKLNKQLEEFETTRKAIKKAVNEPYDLFNKAYDEKIAKQFKDADSILKTSIDSVENGLKETREMELVAYFSSLIPEEINFLKFSQMNLKINLSDSMKSLKSEIEKFVTGVLSDYNLIMTQDNASRILVRYQTTLNASQSIMTVKNEVDQENALNSLQAVKIVDEPKVEPVKVYAQDVLEEPIIDEPRYTSTFKVSGTKAQLVALKRFILDNGITLFQGEK